MDYDTVSYESDLRIPLYDAFIDIAACNNADVRNFECVSDNSLAEQLFLIFRIKHTVHSILDIIDDIVDDSVQSDLDISICCLIGNCSCRSYIESDDDSVRCLSQHYVGLVDSTYAGVDNIDLDFRSLEFLE